MRVQELMPDVLHWLGIARIDRLVSMSHMKHAPIVASGIEVVERVPIPDGLVPADAAVEIDAKKASGYYAASMPHAIAQGLPTGRALLD
jgi:GTP cyclohydrolase II